MSTFIGQLVGFAAIVFLVVRYVVPPVRRLMAARQATVRQQLKDAAAASDRLTESTTAHSKAVEDAKAESKRVVEEAESDSKRITEQLSAQAGVEAERIKSQGGRQVDLLRTQLSRQLRLELGHEAVRQAGELVRNFVADSAQQSATVDRFLDDLDAMAPASADVQYPLMTKMRSSSRVALTNLSEWFSTITKDLDNKGLSTLSGELVSVAQMLDREIVVTRYLTVPAEDAEPRTRLIERLLAGQVGDATLDVLRSAVSERWSASSDLIDALEHVSRQALLEVAEREDKVDEIEEQLFRFSRILDAQPRLAILLGDYAVPVEGRVALLRKGARQREHQGSSDRGRAADPDGRVAQGPAGRGGHPVPRRGCGGAPRRSRRAGQRRGRPERRPAHPSDRGAQPHLWSPGGGAAADRQRTAGRAAHLGGR